MFTIKKKLIIFAVLLCAVCAAVLSAFGWNYTVRLSQLKLPDNADKALLDCRIVDGDGASITGYDIEDGVAVIRLTSEKRGRTNVEVFYGEEALTYFTLYTHPSGVITFETAFGDSSGDIVIPIAGALFMAAVLWCLIKKYRADVRRNMYQYSNVMELGLIVFMCFFLIYQIWQSINYRGVIDSVNDFLGVLHMFSVVVLPVAFVLSILLTISNINLIRKEGRSFKNMLAASLSVGLCLLTLFPIALGEYLQWSPNPIMDVHNEQGAGLYIETFTESVVSMFVTYLECILIGTVAFGIKAARHIPAFDKDYILILGCAVRKDGTLPPLLRSRADRAMEFARMQKEKTGKDVIFVPSGGQGADEAVAEADAVAAYLRETGVPDERILPENASANTYENIRNSMKLIREKSGDKDPSVAFSTTNYHVFRSGLIAHEQGERLEGIGSATKRYFWINAFVREFIATLVSERKKHILIILALTAMIIAAVIIKYLSVVI